MSDDVKELAKILADWSAGSTFTIYLFGSRIRGDHRPDSDVDVLVPLHGNYTEYDMEWWGQQNAEEFASINALLPGPLKLQEPTAEDFNIHILKAAQAPIYRDRNVICVWMPPKPKPPLIPTHQNP